MDPFVRKIKDTDSCICIRIGSSSDCEDCYEGVMTPLSSEDMGEESLECFLVSWLEAFRRQDVNEIAVPYGPGLYGDSNPSDAAKTVISVVSDWILKNGDFPVRVIFVCSEEDDQTLLADALDIYLNATEPEEDFSALIGKTVREKEPGDLSRKYIYTEKGKRIMWTWFDPRNRNLNMFLILVCLGAVLPFEKWALDSLTYEFYSLFLPISLVFLYMALIGFFIIRPVCVCIIRWFAELDTRRKIRVKPHWSVVVSTAIALVFIIGFTIFCEPRHEYYLAKKQQLAEHKREMEEDWERIMNSKYSSSHSAYRKNYSSGYSSGYSGKSSSSSGGKYYGGSGWDSTAEEFAEEYADEFDSWEDAYDYWEEEHAECCCFCLLRFYLNLFRNAILCFHNAIRGVEIVQSLCYSYLTNISRHMFSS